MSYKRKELLTLREHLVSPLGFGGVRVTHRCSSVLCCAIVLVVFVLLLVYPLLPVFLDSPFLIAPSFFAEQISECNLHTDKK